jgi:hypothetical protein
MKPLLHVAYTEKIMFNNKMFTICKLIECTSEVEIFLKTFGIRRVINNIVHYEINDCLFDTNCEPVTIDKLKERNG